MSETGTLKWRAGPRRRNAEPRHWDAGGRMHYGERRVCVRRNCRSRKAEAWSWELLQGYRLLAGGKVPTLEAAQAAAEAAMEGERT